VGSLVGGANSAFKVGASDAAGALVSTQPPDRVLLVLITPSMNMSLVSVEPHELEIWIFNSVEVYEL